MIKNWFKNKSRLTRLQTVLKLTGQLAKKEHILDVGCGEGEIIYSLAAKFNISAVGLDVSNIKITDCKKRYSLPNLVFKEGNILCLPIREHSFDVVISMSLIEWLADYKNAIREVARVLSKDGVWIVSIPNWYSPFRKIQKALSRIQRGSYLHDQKNRLPLSEFYELAELSGFAVIQVVYQILPFLPVNIGCKPLRQLGMMCVIVLKKVD